MGSSCPLCLCGATFPARAPAYPVCEPVEHPLFGQHPAHRLAVAVRFAGLLSRQSGLILCSAICVCFSQHFQQFGCGVPAADGHGLVGRCCDDFSKPAFCTLGAETL